MDDLYSTYEAKARFSEILRRVREGRTIRVSYHGKPVAEIRPIGATTGLHARLERLAARGVLARPDAGVGPIKKVIPARVADRAGALSRFLASRDE